MHIKIRIDQLKKVCLVEVWIRHCVWLKFGKVTVSG